MNRVKAWFVSMLPMMNMAILVHAIIALNQGGRILHWAGPALSSLAMVGFFAYVFSPRVARTSANAPLVIVLSATGVGVAAIARFMQPDLAPGELPLLYTLASFVGTLLYVFWYSRLRRTPNESLSVGSMLPSFTVEGGDGEPVRSDDFRGAPAVFLFFRGNWCPLCMAQIREIAARYRELHDRGVKVALISPQSHRNTRGLANKFDVPFLFLTDPGAKAARQLGIVHEGGLPAGMEILGYEKTSVFPTVVIIDAAGKILFCDQTDNYRVRPEPDTFLAVLDGAPTSD